MCGIQYSPICMTINFIIANIAKQYIDEQYKDEHVLYRERKISIALSIFRTMSECVMFLCNKNIFEQIHRQKKK